MQHGQKVHKQPIDLLEKTGNKILNIPDGHICCGSAGTYNILQSDIAKRLLKQKIENINKVKPDFISTGNIGCIMQITNGTNIPILHTVELIDWYTGGPKPKSLGFVMKKKFLITRKLLRTNEERATKLWDAKLNLNDEVYSQKIN